MKRLLGYSFVALLLMLSACGIDNTMYNARNYFASAMDRPLAANGRPTPQAVAEYTKAIQKCGVILSEEPDGKRADDALFLMARALYYKRNSAFQAKDAFENLIRGYPNSKHVPEAHIYLAKVLQDVNQPDESEAVLERFIRDSRFVDHHARALLVLADFEIQSEDYHRAQFWLERIITNHRNTREFREAYFLFGRNYYEQKDYQRSLDEFQSFISTRGIDKQQRMDARYFIALNHYHLGQTDPAYREARYLVRNEQTPQLLSRARVLLGRVLLADGREEDGLNELQRVTSDYPRTENSAAAYYHMGRYKFFTKGLIDEAVADLNRVRGEFARSEHADAANRISTALVQIKPNRSLDITRDADAWLQHKYRRAENFLDPLALPDSAVVTFQRVISQRDSITLQIGQFQAQIDSLDLRIATLQDSLLGSVDQIDQTTLTTDADELPQEPTEQDPEPDIEDKDPATTDEQESEVKRTENPDAEPELSPTPAAVEPDLATLEQIRAGIISEQTELAELINRFDEEILPFCYYSIFSIIHDDPARAEKSQEIYEILQSQYPRNMYFRAATALREGHIPRLIDPDYEEALEAFDAALQLYPPFSDSLVSMMQGFLEEDYEDLRLRANYRLGWHFSFEEPDTTRAKTHLAEVLADPEAGDYGSLVRRFFDGQKFLLRDSGLEPESQEPALETEEPEPAEDEPEAAPDPVPDLSDIPEEPKEDALPEEQASDPDEDDQAAYIEEDESPPQEIPASDHELSPTEDLPKAEE